MYMMLIRFFSTGSGCVACRWCSVVRQTGLAFASTTNTERSCSTGWTSAERASRLLCCTYVHTVGALLCFRSRYWHQRYITHWASRLTVD